MDENCYVQNTRCQLRGNEVPVENENSTLPVLKKT